ncbi:MAG: class I SAM-dependent methyltransferase [Planctomycetaceae bacterium]
MKALSAINDPTASWTTRLDAAQPATQVPTPNPLEQFFNAHKTGRGIWKWRHYFEIYHRHLSRFVGQEVHVLEIGVYSGGSLEMWKQYFGPRAKIYGVDIEPACKSYEDDQVKIFIGDQADPEFWRAFKQEVPTLDIIIDDGGHEPYQQTATLEEVFPHLRSGGVYLCEDITCRGNDFSAYVAKLSDHLHAYDCVSNHEDVERRMVVHPTSFQRAVHSIHLYPFVAVLERAMNKVDLVAAKHGTQWEPFLK